MIIFDLYKKFKAKKYHRSFLKKYTIGDAFCESKMYTNSAEHLYKNIKIKNGNKENVKIGDNNNLSLYLDLKSTGKFETKNYVFMNSGCKFYISNNLKIGNYCLFGPNVTIWDSNNHSLNPNSRMEDAIQISKGKLNAFSIGGGDIEIEDNVWIGMDTLILGGVKIGKNSVISARSVITKDVPPNTLVGGIPAKIIKKIDVE